MANGTVRARVWQRWKRFAHRAAEIQSFAVLTLLYWIVVVPIGVVRKRPAGTAGAAWKIRPPLSRIGLSDARRQS